MDEWRVFSKPIEVCAKDAPLLYMLIQALVLSFQLDWARQDQELIGVRTVQGVKNINHAQFIDDTILLGGTSTNSTRRFKAMLDSYYKVSGNFLN